MIGVVGTLVDYMLDECETHVKKWIENCSVERQVTYYGASFTGGSCKTLLENVNSLRSNKCLFCLKYVQTLQDFKSVVHDCFGNVLRSSYEKSIEKFKSSFLSLEVSVTPKIHAVFYHVPDFCRSVNKSLGFFSEQTTESVHHDFNETWKKYKVSKRKPIYETRLLRAVCEYNSLHL